MKFYVVTVNQQLSDVADDISETVLLKFKLSCMMYVVYMFINLEKHGWSKAVPSPW